MRRRGRRARSRWWPRSLLPAVDCVRSTRRTARRPNAAGSRRSRPDRGSCARSRPRSTLPWRPFPGISAVGEDAVDEREDAPRDTQKRSATIAVLNTRRMRFKHEAAPVRVHERMALTSVDLLSSIVPAWPAGLGGLGALAVDDSAVGLASRPTRSRSAITSAWFIRSKRPSSRHAANQR